MPKIYFLEASSFGIGNMSGGDYRVAGGKASLSLSGQLKQKLSELDSKIERLIDLFISQEIGEQEYQNLKAKLLNEKKDLQERLGQIEKVSARWLEQAKNFITTCNKIGSVAWQENPPSFRDFLKTIGSNFVLKDLTLYFSYIKPYDIIAKSYIRYAQYSLRSQGVLDWRARGESAPSPGSYNSPGCSGRPFACCR